MCNLKSALLLKDRVFVPDYDSHDSMLKELGIPDDYLHASKTFVRVELSPADGNPSSDPMGWRIKIDQDILPDWFDHKVDEPRVKEAITEWCKVHVMRDGVHEVHDGVWIATGSATVKATGSATVTATDSATVTATGSATVKASDSATVTATDSATVKAFGSATVKAYGSATVKATGSATVILPKKWQTKESVTLHDEAICINHKTHTIKSAIKWAQEDAK